MNKNSLAAVCSILFICGIYIERASCLRKSSFAVKRIDHILLTPADPRGLYDFLTAELKLPIAWAYRDYEGFASGGIFCGNVNLEALLMNQENLSSVSYISGIAFEPAETTDEAVNILKQRQIPFNESQTYEFGPEQSKIKMWTTTILKDFLPGSVIFICEYHPGIFNPPLWRNTLQKKLKEIKGGPLGIEYVKEIEIRVKEKESTLQKWQNLLNPYLLSSDGCFALGDGPRLCINESDTDHIYSIKIKVKSLDEAREFLLSRGLIRQEKKHSITLDPEKTFGILFEIVEIE